MINRGNVQTSTVGYKLSADINGNTVDGTPWPIDGPEGLKFGSTSVTVVPSGQFIGSDVILPVGIPVIRFVFFRFSQIPVSSFSGPVTYNLTVTDSFGYESIGTVVTHGEFMESPGIPTPPGVPTNPSTPPSPPTSQAP
jgi:hypothetical protein